MVTLMHVRKAPLDLAYENAARSLLARYPLEGEPHDRVHLVIVGLTPQGEALATQAARVGHYANAHPLRLTLVDRGARERTNEYLARKPGLASICDLKVEPRELAEVDVAGGHFLEPGEPEKVTVVFCLEEHETNLRLVLSQVERASRGLTAILLTGESEARIPAASAEQLARARVHFFAAASHAIQPADDAVAKAIAAYYRAKYGGSEWSDLDEDLRNSNRVAADHIDIKLRAVGAERVRGAGDAAFRFTAAEVELLAEIEHRRWWADRLLNGWTRGEPKDPARKIHPDLKPWLELSEPVRDKDRQQVNDLAAILSANGEAIRRN
jgi:hypothetical protein